jgi:hypothetical protein
MGFWASRFASKIKAAAHSCCGFYFVARVGLSAPSPSRLRFHGVPSALVGSCATVVPLLSLSLTPDVETLHATSLPLFAKYLIFNNMSATL